MKRTVLVVDDDQAAQRALLRILSSGEYDCIAAGTGEEGLAALSEQPIDMVLLDLHLPDQDGIAVLSAIRERGHAIPVLMMSGDGSIDAAVRSVQLGALDFVQKPMVPERVLVTVQNALRFVALSERNAELEASLLPSRIIGESPAIQNLVAMIERAAPTEGRILITGPNGTGKELVADAIHAHSKRREKPFIKVNCAAIPHELIENELFGHEKGAFTGAHASQRGRFERAHEGTIFLDEIGEMPLSMQPKVLRVIQEGELERVGGAKTISVDCRVIAATNRDLEQMVKDGAFREDLYYRLNVIRLTTPALSERRADIPALASSFFEKACERNGRPRLEVSAEALEALQRHDFPGNVRELQNIVERIVILSDAQEVGREDIVRIVGPLAAEREELAPESLPARTLFEPGRAYKAMVEDAQREIIEGAIAHCGGNMKAAASVLQMERSTLYKRCRALGLLADRIESRPTGN